MGENDDSEFENRALGDMKSKKDLLRSFIVLNIFPYKYFLCDLICIGLLYFKISSSPKLGSHIFGYKNYSLRIILTVMTEFLCTKTIILMF